MVSVLRLFALGSLYMVTSKVYLLPQFKSSVFRTTVKCSCIKSVPPESVIIARGTAVVEVTAGEQFPLTCHARGGKPAAAITWQSPDGTTVPADSVTAADYIVTKHNDSLREDATSRLTLVPSRADEGRQYVCLAKNAAMLEPMSAAVRLHVQCKVLFITLHYKQSTFTYLIGWPPWPRKVACNGKSALRNNTYACNWHIIIQK